MAALDALQVAPQDFDILVTDFNMPVMSGMALAEAALALRGDLPVVISSGQGDRRVAAHGPALRGAGGAAKEKAL